MRILSVIIIVVSLIGLGFASKTKRARPKSNSESHSAVVLELFTSEGCSSCPPADKLLPELVKAYPNAIPLSFHVDYWNHLGWTDPFSSSDNSDRQKDYASKLNLESIYTPQLIVNGEYESVGSNRDDAEASINKVLNEKPIVIINIKEVKSEHGQVNFVASLEGDFKKTNLIAALVQKHATMKVNAGENDGATLSHINVVRSFEKEKAGANTKFELSIPSNLADGNWQLVVFAQREADLKIVGATVYNPGLSK